MTPADRRDAAPRVVRSRWPAWLRRVPGGRRAWVRYAHRRYADGTILLAPVRWRDRGFWFGGPCDAAPDAVFFDAERYEPGVACWLTQWAARRRSPTVFDVGANNGQMLTLLHAICPTARVTAFEPFAALAASCRAIIQANGWRQSTVVRAAATDKDGVVPLYYESHALCCASTVAGFRPMVTAHGTRIDVPAIRLDTYVERNAISRVDLIKIDVEGGELDVLDGAQDLLDRDRPDLLIEVLSPRDPDPMLRAFRTERVESMWALLCGLGYRCWRVPARGQPIALDRLDANAPAEDANYVFTVRGA
jgi:FkbM family methyltransferase